MNTKKIHEFSREEYEACFGNNKSLPNKHETESFVSFVLSVHKLAFIVLLGLAVVLVSPLALLTLVTAAYDFLIHIKTYQQVVVLLTTTGLLSFGWVIYKKLKNPLKKGLLFLIKKLILLGAFSVFFLLAYLVNNGSLTILDVLSFELIFGCLYILLFKM